MCTNHFNFRNYHHDTKGNSMQSKHNKIPERFLATSIFAGIFLMLFCIFIITPLQHYAMPKLGYTRCNILKGHPNIYYSDWVKNPDWCVRGKSREWVKEQARLAQ